MYREKQKHRQEQKHFNRQLKWKVGKLTASMTHSLINNIFVLWHFSPYQDFHAKSLRATTDRPTLLTSTKQAL
jgi:hypothetical protein